jgi:hypothetical protein
VIGQPVAEGGGCPLPAEGAYTAFTVHLAGLPGYPRTVATFCRHHGAPQDPVTRIANDRLRDLTAALDRVPPGGLYLRAEWFKGGANLDVPCDGPNDVARLDDAAVAEHEQAICAAIRRLARLTERATGTGPIGNEHAVLNALHTIARDANRLIDQVTDRTTEGKA